MSGDELDELVWPEFCVELSKSDALVGGDDANGEGFVGDVGFV
jgi:hypothetical protein